MCSYVETYDLQQPSDDIQYVLKHIATKLGKRQRVKAITGVGKGMLMLQIHLLHTILLNLCYSEKLTTWHVENHTFLICVQELEKKTDQLLSLNLHS